MYRGLLVASLIALSVRIVSAQGGLTLEMVQPTPLGTVAETIAMLGGLNVVVPPPIRKQVTLRWENIPAVEALERLATENSLHVTKVPYTSSPTYIFTEQPLDATRLMLVGPPPLDTTPRNFDFRRPTPASSVLQIMGRLGGTDARWEGADPPSILLELKGLSSVEAIHLLAHSLGAVISHDGTGYVVRPGPTTPSGTGGGLPPPAVEDLNDLSNFDGPGAGPPPPDGGDQGDLSDL